MEMPGAPNKNSPTASKDCQSAGYINIASKDDLAQKTELQAKVRPQPMHRQPRALKRHEAHASLSCPKAGAIHYDMLNSCADASIVPQVRTDPFTQLSLACWRVSQGFAAEGESCRPPGS